MVIEEIIFTKIHHCIHYQQEMKLSIKTIQFVIHVVVQNIFLQFYNFIMHCKCPGTGSFCCRRGHAQSPNNTHI